MAEEETEAPAAAPAKTGGGLLPRLLAGAGIFVVTLAAVVAGGFINHQLYPAQELMVGADGQLTLKPPPAEPKHEPAAAAAGDKADTPPRYFAIDPPLVVNFNDRGETRYLQVTIEVMARDEQVIAAVQQHLPLIRNDLILLLSNRSYDDLMSREGKERLREEARAELERILKREAGRGGIESLLFTSFVLQ